MGALYVYVRETIAAIGCTYKYFILLAIVGSAVISYLSVYHHYPTAYSNVHYLIFTYNEVMM